MTIVYVFLQPQYQFMYRDFRLNQATPTIHKIRPSNSPQHSDTTKSKEPATSVIPKIQVILVGCAYDVADNIPTLSALVPGNHRCSYTVQFTVFW